MHDPMTVAHEIKYPWFKDKPWPKQFRRNYDDFSLKMAWDKMSPEQKSGRSRHWPEGYRGTFVTIWHVDPEKGGCDDSCGYSYVRLNKKQKEVLRNTAWSEGQYPHFLCCNSKEWTGNVSDAESLYRGLCFLVCRVLRIKMTYDEVCKYASEAIHIRVCEKYGGVFCFLAGYHTNSKKDSADDRRDHFFGILCNVARVILTEKRPWWKHPKWHVWHWKIQCHPLLEFKRWAFSRCCKCGRRFTWGYAPISNSWNSTGPRWFRGETDCYHSDCRNPESYCCSQIQK